MPPSPPAHDPSSLSVTVVIAACNEQHRLRRVLAGLPPVDEIIVVDGDSADDTVAVARAAGPHVRVLRQTRAGRGNALACGFAAATGDVVATLPADGTADPRELPRFVAALRAGAEAAHGSRFRPGGEDRSRGRLTRLGYAILCRIMNVLFGARFTDPVPTWHAYRRTALPVLDLPALERRRPDPVWGDGPEIAALLAMRAAAQGLRVVEVPSVGYPPLPGPVWRVRVARTALREWRRKRRGLPVPPRAAAVAPTRRPVRSAARHDVPQPGRRFPANSGSLYDTHTGIGYDRSAAPHETTGGVRYPTSARPASAPPAGPASAPPAAPVSAPAATSVWRAAPAWRSGSADQSGPAWHSGPAVQPVAAAWHPSVPAADPDFSGLFDEREGGRAHQGRSAAGRHAVPGDPAVHRLDPGDSGVHHLPPADDGFRHVSPAGSGVHHSFPADSGIHHLPPADSGIHHLSPADSGIHHLSPADSGIHHLGPRDRRHRAGAVYGSGPGDTGVHDWDEPDDRLLRQTTPREVGGGRRRLEYRDRHPDESHPYDSGFAAGAGDTYEAGWAPGAGYASEAGFPPAAGYTSAAGLPPAAGYTSAAGLPPAAGYAPEAGYASGAGYPPRSAYLPADRRRR